MINLPPTYSLSGSLDQTLRRYYIDDFFSRQASLISVGSLVLDLGGNKIQKRGLFDIDRLRVRVVYANLSDEKIPDVQADAGSLPFDNNSFDVVICSELLEHIYTPKRVLCEVMRILKPHGILLITVPFMVQYHADPHDYGRYTDHYWNQILNDVGFIQVRVEKQGYFWSVLLDMLRGYVLQLHVAQKKFAWVFIRYFLEKAIVFGRRKVVAFEIFPKLPEKAFFHNFTTGFGIVAIKK